MRHSDLHVHSAGVLVAKEAAREPPDCVVADRRRLGPERSRSQIDVPAPQSAH
ncbi:MAG: hypothetical protein OEM67_05740 [Thermoleophilia bacterium]|nr:hypothetical protein [Thermoleophilia bacterium]